MYHDETFARHHNRSHADFGMPFRSGNTATVVGIVSDESGEPAVGATVRALHTPSGTYTGATTRTDGRYTLANLRVGGPYTIEVIFTGYEKNLEEGIMLSVGQCLPLDFKLSSSVTALGQVEISGGRGSVVNDERTGAATNISRQQIATLPTISRSAADYTRPSPASTGNSFASPHDHFHHISLA